MHGMCDVKGRESTCKALQDMHPPAALAAATAAYAVLLQRSDRAATAGCDSAQPYGAVRLNMSPLHIPT
jgi:hypothetical protein